MCQGLVSVALDIITSHSQLVVPTNVEHITLLIDQSAIGTLMNFVDIVKPDYLTFFNSNEANLLSKFQAFAVF